MTRSALGIARVDASLAGYTLAGRRRMSLEELAVVFQASGACPAVPRDTMERARVMVTLEVAGQVVVGQTFAETVALSRPLLDLYEAETCVRRIA